MIDDSDFEADLSPIRGRGRRTAAQAARSAKKASGGAGGKKVTKKAVGKKASSSSPQIIDVTERRTERGEDIRIILQTMTLSPRSSHMTFAVSNRCV